MKPPSASSFTPPGTAKREELAVNVLWTGGWDSTFRVLMLTLVHGIPVQPYYMFVSTRKGSGQELATIQQLKKLIRQKSPAAGAMIRPTIIVERDEIPPSERRERQLETLRGQRYLGKQYAGLARLCDWTGVQDMELCIHRDDQAHPHVAALTIVEACPGGSRYRLDPAAMDEVSTRLFEHFRFPLLDLDKIGMREIAARHGFADVMMHTWFCHSPRNGKPCGVCNPCEYAIEEGLGWRVPRSSKLRSAAIKAVRRLKMLVLQPGRAGRKMAERLGLRAD